MFAEDDDIDVAHLSPSERRQRQLRHELMELHFLNSLGRDKVVPIPAWLEHIDRENELALREMTPEETLEESRRRAWDLDFLDFMHGYSEGTGAAEKV